MIAQIEIMQTALNLWVTFQDETEAELGLHIRQYRNPTVSSLDRLTRAISSTCTLHLERDGMSFIIYARPWWTGLELPY